MQKIPVGRTIAFAYRFLFVHIGTVVGIAWFPALLDGAVAYGAQLFQASHAAAVTAGDLQANGLSWAFTGGAILVTLLATSVASVGITRHALGMRTGNTAISFQVGRTEWHMFAANLRYIIGAAVLIVLALLVSIVAYRLAGGRLDTTGPIPVTPATVLAGLITSFVLVYACVAIARMGFLLSAVVVAEDKSGLKRAHELVHGNVWRMIVVLVALWIPTAILLLAGLTAILRASLGPDLLRFTPDEVARRIDPAIAANLLPWTIFTAVVMILWWGLFYAGAAYAYRALAPDSANRIPPAA